MIRTSARLLALLGLLQTRRTWSGAELAARVNIGQRTLRKDVAQLRALGYPVESVRGPQGGYRLGGGGRLPPLLLGYEEVVAVIMGLCAVQTVPGMADVTARAVGKLNPVIPGALRRRARVLFDHTDHASDNTVDVLGKTQSIGAESCVDPAVLWEVAGAISDHQALRFFYGGEQVPVEAEPHRLVVWQQRWYLVARRRPDRCWQVFRTDWMTLRVPGGGSFVPEPLPGGDYAALVLRTLASSSSAVHGLASVDAPAQELQAHTNRGVGIVRRPVVRDPEPAGATVSS